MKYRAEIDGLRALAVISVIFFHAGFELFSGGFVGVDVFFVISGYLITTIIIDDLENNKFSIFNFYERRVRRIFPALIFVLLVTYTVSYFIYLPSSHKVVGQYVVSSILSISNILLYLKGNDYFGLENNSNPLFHTWSLGVEEQFYLLFPILLLLFWNIGKRKLFWLFCTIALLSILVSEWGSKFIPTANFYLLPTRSWELITGSIVAFLVKKQGVKKNNTLAMLGILAIIFPIFYFNKNTPFPSIYTLVPVSGVILLILFAEKNTFAAKILSFKVFVGIGLISYSLYLWHLPIEVYFSYLFLEHKILFYTSYIFLFIISFISYHFVERPFRKKLSRFTTFSYIVLSSIILLILGVLGHFNGGYPNRTEMFSKLQFNNGWGLDCNGNTIVNLACATNLRPKIAVLGNSYAMMWVNSLRATENASIVQLTQDSCAIGFIDIKKDINSLSCKKFYHLATKTILESESIETVILSSPFERELSTDEYIASLTNLLDKLKSKKIIVIGPPPNAQYSVGECLLRQSLISDVIDCDFQVKAKHDEKITKLIYELKSFNNIKFYDITDIICPNRVCEMRPKEGLIIYIDNGHLSVDGANYIFSKINLKLQD